MTLPSLDNLAYRVDDDGDHPGGGHCAWLGGDTRQQDRIAIIGQYATALRVLVDAAEKSGDGWSLTRPILFATHQLCENALDVANHFHGVDVPTTGKKRHSLTLKMTGALDGGVYDKLTPEWREWCQAFIETIAPLTGNGYPGRYALSTIQGRLQLDDVWCCINPQALADTAIQFAGLTIGTAAEVNDSTSSSEVVSTNIAE
ncbi:MULTISPECIES: hypothetical protein [unclassified Microbacterium]|uniref:hypothetical protein n=1 Tax=unclassified Microbacterium TaxID=2609290 RepID=UPI000CFB85BC|nr:MULTISPECIES: hypothetical protein [unclassified Microbacterium]PQZ53149.1 hypothetical protein CQ032_15700 [Microbacterium sp. MYb43]PQZ74691.1 hypothetical protein CQ031_15045 [Microbacterium sp. MYb40]PRB18779.1 hypothetical protein CQ040_16350 [Microbacterium sp. MYb54]PRB23639.1 hypothetical protein CQ037_17150 [Microbacterium sp. MYb50]PRB63352.1 hypothetical protein CQ021_16755 [Microbacterium sp. MYb24]